MTRPLRWALELAFGVVAGLLVYGLVRAVVDGIDRERSEPLRLLEPQMTGRDAAPDFELRGRDGEVVRLRDLRGRPVVLNLWSLACPPCIEELPSLARLDLVARERGTFSVVTVCAEGDSEAVARALPRGSRLVVLLDPEHRVITGEYGTERFPETFLIDSDGRVRARFDGSRDWSSPVVLNLLETL